MSSGGSKLRTRRLDVKKPVKIYGLHEQPDVEHEPARLKAPPQIVSGVEKEEEEEEHLQAVLNSRQHGIRRIETFIPTPDASRQIPDDEYTRLYSPTFKHNDTLIRIDEEFSGVGYCADERDAEWLALNCVDVELDKCEACLDICERLGNQKMWMGETQVPTYEEFISFMKQDEKAIDLEESIVERIFEYWRTRRYEELAGKPVQALLKVDETGPQSEMDPYVCFRKREMKSMRKTRRCDVASLDKLKRLRDEMKKALELLELVSQREKLRKESLVLEQQVFEQRIFVKRLKKKLGIVNEREKSDSPTRKRSKDGRVRISGTELQRDVASAEEKARTHKMNEEAKGWLDLTEDPYIPAHFPQAGSHFWTNSIPFTFSEKLSEQNTPPITCLRRRIGRGGRILYDRHTTVQNFILTEPAKRQLNTVRGGKHSPQRDLTNEASQEEETHWRRSGQWAFDSCGDDTDAIMELDDVARFVHYRSQNLVPAHTQLMNRPTYLEQFDYNRHIVRPQGSVPSSPSVSSSGSVKREASGRNDKKKVLLVERSSRLSV